MQNSAKGAKRQKKNKTTKKKTPKTKVVATRSERALPLPLPLDTKHYGMVLADPFIQAGLEKPPGVPTAPAFPSRKWRTAIRGSFATGTQGIGFVFIDPYHTVFSNVQCGAYSTSTFAANNFTSAGTGVAALFNIQQAYSSTTLSNGIVARLVAGGIRVRYTGTTLNRGGSVVGVYARDDFASLNSLTYTDVLTKYPFTSSQPVSEDWEGATWFPVQNADLDYYDPPQINSYSWVDYASLGVMVYSPSTTSLTFDFEMTMFWEFQGPEVISLSPSTSDFLGMSNVIEGVAKIQPGPERGWLASFADATASAIESTSEWMYSHPRTVQVLSAGASHLLSGGRTQSLRITEL